MNTNAKISEKAKEIHSKMVETRRDFHMHPELSGEEKRTAGIVASQLKELGLEVETDIGGHGVIGLLKGDLDGPVIAWRADMDAFPSEELLDKPYKSRVPGVKHVCGHDVHTTIGLGIAEVLASMKDQIKGQVKFIFQPAEEVATGAKSIVEAGGLSNPKPEAIFGLHVSPLPVGKVGSISGEMLPGITMFNVEIKPNGLGQSEIKQLLQQCFSEISKLTILEMPENPMSLFSDSETNEFDIEKTIIVAPYQTISDSEKLAGFQGIVRTFQEELRLEAKEKIEKLLSESLGKANLGYELQFPETPSLPNVVNDDHLEKKFRQPLQSILDDENLLLLNKPWPLNSEDFAVYQQYIPGVFYWLGVANSDLGIAGMPHTPDFDVDENSIMVGIKAMSKLLLSYAN